MEQVVYNPSTGEWELVKSYSSLTTLGQKATGYDWLNAILSGATNILGGLFPNGVNNGNPTGGVLPPNYNPTPQVSTSQDNTLMYILLAFAFVLLLTKK